MTEERRAEAFRYIESQLDNGYIDLGINEQDELEIIQEAIKMLKDIDEWNSIGLINPIAPEDLERALEQMKKHKTICIDSI